MIWLVANNFERAVNLFNQNQPRHLMRESHGRNAESKISSAPNFFAESERAANYKSYAADAVQTERGDFFCKIFGAQSFTGNVQHDNKRIAQNLRKKFGALVFDGFALGNFGDFDFGEIFYALEVFADAVDQKFFLEPSNRADFNSYHLPLITD